MTNCPLEDFLDIKPSSSQDEINKAYRKKSRLLHPDKAKQSFVAARSKSTPKPKPGQKKNPGVHVNKGPSQHEIRDAVKEASERFARLGIVANILRGGGRERYDHFLSNGFPRWRGTGYYYARFRPGLGMVLLGLFIVGGGGAHYGAMYVSWRRQKEFVERYIRHARRVAWGDELGIQGIPETNGSVAPPPGPSEQEESPMVLNRRQRRMQDKDNKKDKDGKKAKAKAKASRTSGTSTPTETAPRGDKKRVQAENGKILIVDPEGNVYLEQENEDGEKGEYLLDVDEIPRPTFKQTILFRLPFWFYGQATSRAMAPFRTKAEADLEDEEEKEEASSIEDSDDPIPKAKTAASGTRQRRGKRNGKVR
ncbi:MAG: hypothetical protein M1827_000825 [Pycnora praestabilis]|nr:MAG: hypothetical protein M1827_000825 [Pycnora praestabilis]